MLFNSLIFPLFFVLVFALYWSFANRRVLVRNLFLILASYVFYGWWDWRFLGLIILSSTVDYYAGLQIFGSSSKGSRKAWLILSLCVNLGMLGFFKYYNFFMDSLYESLALLGFDGKYRSLNVILPVGISFYTFQTLSYTIDIYYRKLEPTRDIGAFFAFVSFFPQLVAGPIERAFNLLPQFSVKGSFNYANAVLGSRLILWGFVKKMVIADNLAYVADAVYASPGDYHGYAALIGTLAFAFQIYCDFSGYSDIAIGLAHLLGFKLMTNFREPYFASSIRAFWRRWHISLSTWFRDYVYIPLGGNQATRIGWYRNLLITFVVSGLWHGANWTFVAWGFLHGAYLIIELLIPRKGLLAKIPSWLMSIWVFIWVLIAWNFFRAENITEALQMIANYSYPVSGMETLFAEIGRFKVLLMFPLIAFLLLSEYLMRNARALQLFNSKKSLRWVIYLLLIIIWTLFGVFEDQSSFIYFQF